MRLEKITENMLIDENFIIIGRHNSILTTDEYWYSDINHTSVRKDTLKKLWDNNRYWLK